jgi:hypothetical protein
MLAQGQLAATAGAIYTVGAATTARVKTIILFNAGSAANLVKLYAVPNASGAVGTAAAANQFYEQSIPSKTTVEFSPAFPLEYSAQNDTIQGQAAIANNVTYLVNGVES